MEKVISENQKPTTTTRGMCTPLVCSFSCFGVDVPLSSAIAITVAGINEFPMNARSIHRAASLSSTTRCGV
jgi:hypothetical protein